MNRPTIDMTRPTTLYVSFAVALLMVAFILERLPLPSVAQLLHLPNARAIAGGTLCLSITFGLLGASRLAARARAPWQVPQSQSLICFLLFLLTGALGLALSI